MMQRNVAPMLRTFGLIGFACCLALLGAGVAEAAETAARVDPAQANSEPIYPDAARAAGEQGTVLVDVLVRPSGHPSKFRVAQSSGYGDLDNAAVETVLNWHFIPATRDGDTVTDWTTVKVVYQLPQAPAAAPQAQ